MERTITKRKLGKLTIYTVSDGTVRGLFGVNFKRDKLGIYFEHDSKSLCFKNESEINLYAMRHAIDDL